MTFARLIGHATPYWRPLLIISALMLGQTAMMLALPWLGGRLAAGFFSDRPLNTDVILAGVIGIFALRSAISYAVSRILADTSARIVRDLQHRVYTWVQSLPLGYFRARRQGDILACMVDDPDDLSDFLTTTLTGLLPNGIAVLGAFVLMAGIDPLLAGLMLILMPLFYLCLRLMGRRLRPLAVEMRDAHADLVSKVDENLGMMPAIKAFTRERAEAQRHFRVADRLRALTARQERLVAALNTTIRLLAVVAMVGVLRILGDRVTGGDMSLAEFVSFLLYAVFLTVPLSSLAGVWGQIQTARGAATRLGELFDEPPEIIAGRPPLPAIHGDIRFEDVHLTYPGRHAALRGVDLAIAAGETVALVGPNGAGKSTLVNLLMRFDTPEQGRVLIDGTDIADVDLHSLREQIAILSQTVLLFNVTIRDNIAFGRDDASEAQVLAAAGRAQAHDFVADLPQGYDTVIGDRGVRLSGGQAQRIALARALLKDPAILVLDEPTAMFDPEGEVAFITDARVAFADRTVLLITHRPGSLALADRIVTLNMGVVTNETGGTHRVA